MKRSALSVLFFSGIFLFCVRPLMAADFDSALLRLERTKASADLSALVCLTPSSAGAGTEGRIRITFPSSFSISSTLSDWVTSTTDIPSGTTALPGISTTAQTISGTSVTFTTNDLTASTRYCFTLTATDSTTGTVTGNMTATLTSLTSGGSTIDSRIIGLTISEDDEIDLTATVPAQSTDFTAVVEKTRPSGTTFGQQTTLYYEIRYGNTLSYPAEVQVKASWDLGTVAGQFTPSESILTYVVGSASRGYGNVTPVVDTVNRTITWTIPSLPGNTLNQKVSFAFQTTSTFTGSERVRFPVSGLLIGPGTQTPTSTVIHDYLYNHPGPTPTPDPNAPIPTNTPTPIIPVPPVTNVIRNIDLYSISATDAEIDVLLSLASRASIIYGVTPQQLSKRVTTLESKTNQRVALTGLEKDTSYYFRVIAASSDGSAVFSDIFTFRTAKLGSVPSINDAETVILADKTILFSEAIKEAIGGKSVVMLPKDTQSTIQLSFAKDQRIRSLQIFSESRNVLGSVFPERAFAQPQRSELVEIKPGIYTGKIYSPSVKGDYDLFLRLNDANGNISVQKVALLKVTNPLMIVSKSGKPLESASVRLYVLNEKTRLYTELPPQFFTTSYPLRTNSEGIINQVLPPGKYKAVVTALGYKEEATFFSIGPEKDDNYPLFALRSTGYNIFEQLLYFFESLTDVNSKTLAYLDSLLLSRRFYELINLFAVGIFCILTFLAFSHRIGLPIMLIPVFFKHLFFGMLRDKSGVRLIKGVILDSVTNQPLSGVHVFLEDSLSRFALQSTITNSRGEFHFRNLPQGVLGIKCVRTGYFTFYHTIHPQSDHEIVFGLSPEHNPRSIPRIFRVILLGLGERTFELLLIVSILLQLLVGYYFGWKETAPFLVLSLINALYFSYYHRLTHS